VPDGTGVATRVLEMCVCIGAEAWLAGTGLINDSGTRTPLQVVVGNHVLIGNWAGDVVQVDGEEVLIIKETDILAIVG